MQSLMRDADLDIQSGYPVVVFINGEYWGIHMLQQRFDEHYISDKYGVQEDGITILELNGLLSFGKKTDAGEFRDLLDFIRSHDLSIKENYEKVRQQIDVGSFMDFVIANVYFCNSDWPNNNVKFWKYHGGNSDTAGVADGRWRWMLYDTDWGFGYNSLSTPENDLLPKALKIGSVGTIFSGLIQNADFRSEFLKRFKFHLDNTFDSKKVIAKIDSMQEVLAPEMKEHIDRWRVIGSFSAWNENIAEMRRFAQKRPAFQVSQLNSFFRLEGEKQIRLKNEAFLAH
jgi:hypothetical protein